MGIYLRGKSYYYDFVYKTQRYAGCIGPVSRSVAKEEEARKRTEVIEGRLNPAKVRKSPLFDTFANEFLEWAKNNRKPLTCRSWGSRMKPLRAKFSNTKLGDIKEWHLEQYKKARKEAGCGATTINGELTLLKSMLNKAVAWNKLSEHQCRKFPFLKVLNEKIRFFSEDEEQRIITVCSPHLLRIVQTGLLTGFRPRELTSLRPEDVDFEQNLITVAACYAKNGESRTLPIVPQLRAILTEALSVHGDAPTVFVTKSGKPWGPTAYGVCFLAATKRAGVEPCGPHKLRHTFASRLTMSGVDLRTVQELMGHKDIKQTLRYAHLSPQHKRSAMETLESRFSGKSHNDSHNTPLNALPPAYAKAQ